MTKKITPSTDQLSLFETEENNQIPLSLPSSKKASSIKRSLGKLTLPEIRSEVGHCCQLCNQATNVVFGEGNSSAELMFIGEAPGAEEDATGRPFVGAAGRLLDKIIAAIGLKREDVYITNVVKCRPPNNRKPTNDEMESCEPFLFNEIEVVKPKLIVTLGATPLTSLLNVKEGITKTRGQFYDFNGIPVMPTFHPAFLLRVPEKKREVWEDMKKVMTKLQEIRKGNK
ncbi:MAG: uracil-DNA glycosylase [Acidobacteria bacterium]|nr:uracil-DNA glycosylase [Acidobacteriota bacterium]